MNPPLAAKSQIASRLRWKESRQLLPLCGMLAVLAVGMHLVVLIPSLLVPMNYDTQRAIVTSLVIGLPGLFAVGAGAILVGQEKDQQTLLWLNSLPISPGQLVRTKLFLSLMALVGMWLVSFVLLMIFGQFPEYAQADFWEGVLSWPLHTLFLLFAGFALAWKLKTAFGALLALIPVALVPGIVASVISNLTDPTPRIDYFASSPVLIGCQVVACALSLAWCLRSAQKALGPAPAPRVRTIADKQRFVTSSLGSPLPRMSALTWQASKQNAYWLASCAVMLLVALGIADLDPSRDPSPFVLTPLAVLFMVCGISWLGVSTFQGDQLTSRIRFLADRGVSPWRVWLTRQAAPVAILVATMALGAVVVARSKLDDTLAGNVIILAGLCGCGLTIFAVSQWLAQIARSPIVAAVASPAVSIGVLVYLTMANVTLGASLWLIILSAVPLATVTLLLCRRWMDSRRDRTFWLTNAAVATALFVLPLAPLGFTYATLEPADPAAISEIRSLAAANDAYAQPISPDYEYDETPAALAKMRQDERRLAIVKMQLLNQPGPIESEGRLLTFLDTEVRLGRMHLDAGNTDYQEWYRDCVGVTLQVIDGLRKNSRLRAQDEADRLEILLTKQMVAADAKARLGDSLYAQVAAQISNREGRKQARMRAIASSLKNLERDIKEGDAYYFGGYHMNRPNSDVLANMQFLPKAQTMAHQLWQLAQAGDRDTAGLRMSLAEFWHVQPAQMGIGSKAKFYRADELDVLIDQFIASRAPGQQWNAKWERIAAQFASGSETNGAK